MPGPKRDHEGRSAGAFKTRRDYLDQITALVRQGIVDLMLLSIANLERLVNECVFRESRVGTAIRANDAAEIWGARHGVYKAQPSLPHRSALIERDIWAPGRHAGHAAPAHRSRPVLDHLMNDAELDRAAGECRREFRIEAERWRFEHFPELFNRMSGETG